MRKIKSKQIYKQNIIKNIVNDVNEYLDENMKFYVVVIVLFVILIMVIFGNILHYKMNKL